MDSFRSFLDKARREYPDMERHIRAVRENYWRMFLTLDSANGEPALPLDGLQGLAGYYPYAFDALADFFVDTLTFAPENDAVAAMPALCGWLMKQEPAILLHSRYGTAEDYRGEVADLALRCANAVSDRIFAETDRFFAPHMQFPAWMEAMEDIAEWAPSCAARIAAAQGEFWNRLAARAENQKQLDFGEEQLPELAHHTIPAAARAAMKQVTRVGDVRLDKNTYLFASRSALFVATLSILGVKCGMPSDNLDYVLGHIAADEFGYTTLRAREMKETRAFSAMAQAVLKRDPGRAAPVLGKLEEILTQLSVEPYGDHTGDAEAACAVLETMRKAAAAAATPTAYAIVEKAAGRCLDYADKVDHGYAPDDAGLRQLHNLAETIVGKTALAL